MAALGLTAFLLGVPGASAGFDFLAAHLGGRSSNEPAHTITAMDSAASAMEFRREVFDARPKPTPSASESSSPVTSDGSITSVIYAAASEFGLDGSYLLSVASCESALNPGAYNAAGYHGLFQFDQTTWAAYGYGSIYDPTAQARTAARLLAAGQSSRWPNCA
jgi:soluble lytic murein transglycosylase-like protein